MKPVLVDTNVLLDVINDDPTWGAWSKSTLERVGESAFLVINPLIYAEVSVGYPRAEAVDLVSYALREMRGGEVFVPKLEAVNIGRLAGLVAPFAKQVVTGRRPGEKLHETLITCDEATTTYDVGDCYVIEPPARTWASLQPLPHPRVPVGFEYRSDTVAPMSDGTIAERFL